MAAITRHDMLQHPEEDRGSDVNKLLPEGERDPIWTSRCLAGREDDLPDYLEGDVRDRPSETFMVVA